MKYRITSKIGWGYIEIILEISPYDFLRNSGRDPDDFNIDLMEVWNEAD